MYGVYSNCILNNVRPRGVNYDAKHTEAACALGLRLGMFLSKGHIGDETASRLTLSYTRITRTNSAYGCTVLV